MNHANQPNNKINDHTKPKPGPQQFVTSSSSKIRDNVQGSIIFLISKYNYTGTRRVKTKKPIKESIYDMTLLLSSSEYLATKLKTSAFLQKKKNNLFY